MDYNLTTPTNTPLLLPHQVPITYSLTIRWSNDGWCFGLNASKTTTHNYDDWTVTAEWLDGEKNMLATIGHGLPFVYFEISGGDAAINFNGTPTIWFNDNGVLGVSIDGRHYGIFAPTGSAWNSGSTHTSNLNGKNHICRIATRYSSNNVKRIQISCIRICTNSSVEWSYDESTATLTSTYSYKQH